ncbi:Pectinesterase inhibitor domain [Arabidopsis thaliana x Arabidopsis arenosa]|uniref:pectinesterase n=1 Tax=Arabidopsis thaliana x Arabidopsis arenosa TaxID=1240361 RepID=A0A8T1YBI9_9BRAS|nr:Pectinesterase inhibitor domain [Arabidopsis thaliana x Arabidopsis arenosa]
MWNGWNYSSKMKKYVLLGVTALIMAMVICVEANDGSSPSRKMEEIHRESKLMITKTAVTIICSSTDYKQDCTTSLATVRSPDPRNLIRSAFDLAIVSIRSGIDRGMIDLKSRADADVHTRNALNTCRELMDDAIDDLRKTRDKFRGFLFTRLSDFVEDLCVWLSGSITYQQTCIDGFEGIDSEAAMMMERVMRKGQRLTSNGLAIAANLDKLLKAFRIPFPFLRSRRDRLGILGSGSSRDQSVGSSQDPPPNVDSSDNSPKTMESSENRPLDSSENRPSDSSNNRPLDSSENRPKESSENSPQKLTSSENQPLDSSDKLPQKSTSSENQPLDSSESNPQKSTSTENRPLDPTQNSDSSIIRPLDPLRKLNPLNKLDSSKDRHLSEEGEFPPWVTRHSRRLLARGPRNNGIRADVVVAKDGSGKCKTIAQALAMVPMKNTKKFVIHIKQGVYKEKVEVTKKMLHVMFVGDGPTKTIITGDIAFLPNQVGTYRTASVAVNGDYFMAKDIGFENTAGAARHQAVALRVSADFAVFFNCHMNGYQDTLYVHTHRQFYRNCRVSGTIDFVFGDAKAVFQNCEFVIRRPMEHQQCIVTAQGRKDRRETTGIVIHNSRITGDASYLPVKAKNRAFLGRPWKEFSRTIIMNTEIDDVIDPEGWLKWNETFALNTLFYTEYRNRGRGSGQGRRVRWRGIKRISDRVAREFAPGNFLRGNTWIPQTRIPYNAN